MAAGSMAKASKHEKVGTKPLWKSPGEQLPAYHQHIANALIEQGHPKSRAIAIAVAAVKKWKSGIPTGGEKKVHSDTQAAATKADLEWEALKARHNKGKK